MVAYSFARRFRSPIAAGTKTQTIRRERTAPSRHARPGEPIRLYDGMPTEPQDTIGIAPCVLVEPILLCVRPGPLERFEVETPSMSTFWAAAALDRFARRDGFDDWRDLVGFFAEMHPGVTTFSGVRIVWEPLRMVVPAAQLEVAA